MAGYSSRSLVEKLGIKAGEKVLLVNPPEKYLNYLGPLPEGTTTAEPGAEDVDTIHVFVTQMIELEELFPELKKKLKMDGKLWVSWPKKSAKVPTDLDENSIRDIGLKLGLVDVKVIAVDDVWSGLKFVYRLKDRE